MELSVRKKTILAALVEDYIENAEPVGSKTIVRKTGLGLSSATIRNELAELERMGYLEQPHTSAGRVPTAAGYRLYVSELMHRERLSAEETETINQQLDRKMQQLDKLMSDVGKLTSSLTNYPAYALAAPAPATVKRFDLIYLDANSFIIVALLSSDTVKNKLVHLPFSVDQAMVTKLSALFNAGFTGLTEDKITQNLIRAAERASGDTYGLVSVIAAFAIEVLSDSHTGEAFITGAGNLLSHPEFRDPDKASRVMQYLSDSRHLLELPNLPGFGEGNVKVIIGPENVAEELRDSSVVMASYNAGDNMQGLIGVVGPTRMDYSKVAAKLQYIADSLSRILGAGDASSSTSLSTLLLKGDDIDEQ